MADFEVFGPYAIALLMGIGTACVLIWAVLSGALSDTDQAALNFYRAEIDHERNADHRGPRRDRDDDRYT